MFWVIYPEISSGRFEFSRKLKGEKNNLPGTTLCPLNFFGANLFTIKTR
jgi:hypothetical protein